MSPYGGLITYWDALLPRLIERGVQVEVRTPVSLRARVAHGQTWTKIGTPDIFVSTYYTLPPAHVPSLVVLHDLVYEDQPELSDVLSDTLTTERKRSCLELARMILVPSQATADALCGHLLDLVAPVRVIPHGVDDDLLVPPSAEEFRSATRLLRRGGVTGPYALHVGGRRHYKDGALVMTAFAHDPLLYRHLRLVFVGSEGELSADERALVGGNPPVLLGQVDRRILACLYRCAAVVVSASRTEGFGLPMTEAVALGVSIACSDIPAYRERFWSHARFFDPGDPIGLRKAIQKALKDYLPPQPSFPPSWDEAADHFIVAAHEALELGSAVR